MVDGHVPRVPVARRFADDMQPQHVAFCSAIFADGSHAIRFCVYNVLECFLSLKNKGLFLHFCRREGQRGHFQHAGRVPEEVQQIKALTSRAQELTSIKSALSLSSMKAEMALHEAANNKAMPLSNEIANELTIGFFDS